MFFFFFFFFASALFALHVKKKGPVAFALSTLRNMICAVLGCCGTEQDFVDWVSGLSETFL